MVVIDVDVNFVSANWYSYSPFPCSAPLFLLDKKSFYGFGDECSSWVLNLHKWRWVFWASITGSKPRILPLPYCSIFRFCY